MDKKVVRLPMVFIQQLNKFVEIFISIMRTGLIKKTQSGDRKHNLFSVTVHELGHALGVFHSNEKDCVMTRDVFRDRGDLGHLSFGGPTQV